MKVNRSLDVRRKLPLKKSAAATAIDLFAAVTFTVAVSIRSAAVCPVDTILLQAAVPKSTFDVPKYGADFTLNPWLSAGKAVA